MSGSPDPSAPQSATKAHAAAIVTWIVVLILWLIARQTGLVEAPDHGLVADAITGLVGASVSAAVAWIGTWLAPRNTPLVILLLAGLAAGGGLAGCAGWSGASLTQRIDAATGTTRQDRCRLAVKGLAAAQILLAADDSATKGKLDRAEALVALACPAIEPKAV